MVYRRLSHILDIRTHEEKDKYTRRVWLSRVCTRKRRKKEGGEGAYGFIDN